MTYLSQTLKSIILYMSNRVLPQGEVVDEGHVGEGPLGDCGDAHPHQVQVLHGGGQAQWHTPQGVEPQTEEVQLVVLTERTILKSC